MSTELMTETMDCCPECKMVEGVEFHNRQIECSHCDSIYQRDFFIKCPKCKSDHVDIKEFDLVCFECGRCSCRQLGVSLASQRVYMEYPNYPNLKWTL